MEDVQKPISPIYEVIDLPLDSNKYYRIAVMDTMASNQLLAKLANGHPMYRGYLSANYSLVRSSARLTPGMPLEEASALLYKAYTKDAVFNRLFQHWPATTCGARASE